jgi:hypothetical protein
MIFWAGFLCGAIVFGGTGALAIILERRRHYAEFMRIFRERCDLALRIDEMESRESDLKRRDKRTMFG